MSENYLQRRLWYVDIRKTISVDQDFLRSDVRPMVVLGEAGMGKSTLLEQLRGEKGFSVCTARQLIITPNLSRLFGDATTLVIDALDEVPAQREGDAIDSVLRRLAELDLPRFILSCRVADWRSATAMQGIADIYDSRPLELHLEPIDRDDAVTFLTHTLGAKSANHAIEHLEDRGLAGLWHNPQTLELVEKVASRGKLPQSKGDLFEEATRLLRTEHRSEKSRSPLANLSESAVLDASGAGFAALILTGNECMSRDVKPETPDAPIAEVAALPGAASISDVLDSRLFRALDSDRFTYAHRAVGEFLGARWLAKQADTERKRRRLLELLQNSALVPANLRGIHAWLAWHSQSLADRIIAADPMGVIEYGDADFLSASQARTLLNALYALSQENPRFRDWSEYRVGGIVQPALFQEVRNLISDPAAESGLRLLLVQALKGSPLVSKLCDVLLTLLHDENVVFALRSESGDRLAEFDPQIDWPATIQRLILDASENSVRLASELMGKRGYDQFGDELVIDLVKAQLGRSERTVGVFNHLERNFPAERLDALLNGVVAAANKFGTRHDRSNNDALTDLMFTLLAKRLAGPGPDAGTLWSWMAPFNSHYGVKRESAKAVGDALRENNSLRRAVQRHVLLELRNDEAISKRYWRMQEPTSGFQPNEDDVCILLAELDQTDPRWRELVELIRHDGDAGASVRKAAMRFADGEIEAQEWIAQLPYPRVPKWQIEEETRKQQLIEKRDAEWSRHRADFTARIEVMRAGDYGTVLNPAKAYLKLFADMGDEALDGPARIEEWLGAELRDAALDGFEAFLIAEPPHPTAKDIATSHAEGRRWDAANIIVAALAERARTRQGFEGLADERLTAGYIELAHTNINDHAGIPELAETLANLLRDRGQWETTQRMYLESQFATRREHVSGLNALMKSTADSDLTERLGAEWLGCFPNMSSQAEIEIVDQLLTSPSGRDRLLALLPTRLHADLNDQRRYTWDAVGVITDFESTRDRLERSGKIDTELLWALRARLGERQQMRPSVSLNPTQLAWVVRTFRTKFPYASQQMGYTRGDENDWDATNYLIVLINRLGDQVSPEATKELLALRDAHEDGYSRQLRVALAEQKRKRMEAEWVAPDLATIAAAITDRAPTTAPQLQAVMLDELNRVQSKIRGSDVDWYKDFFGGDDPLDENSCRTTILKMFGDLPFDIQALPEGHLGDNKRCDILCILPRTMVPIEIKGQWHRDLWTAADRQLDILYTNDWRAERGIYVVLWFGTCSTKKPSKPPRGIEPPETAEGMRQALAAQSATTRQGRTEIVVLDLTRPA